MAQVAVIGLSTFGLALVRSLAHERCRVLAVDIDERKVDQVRDIADEAIIADARERNALEALRITDYNAVVLSVGEPLDSSLLAALHLRDLKAKRILAKAVSEDHRRLLHKLGVDDAVFPEADMARRVARSLHNPMVIDTVSLGHDFTVAEVAPAKEYVGLKLEQILPRLRNRVSIVGIRDMLRDEIRFNPKSDSLITDSDVLVVIGKDDDVQAFGRNQLNSR